MPDAKEAESPSGQAALAPHYHGHRERLRERFLKGGSDALADYELLELVLFRAIARRDLKPVAKELIKQFGSFAEAVSAPIERLKSIKGLGDAAITELKLVEAAAHQLARGRIKDRLVLSSWSDVPDDCPLPADIPAGGPVVGRHSPQVRPPRSQQLACA